MKISYNWLKNYIDIDKPHEEIANILTSIGLEVDGVENTELMRYDYAIVLIIPPNIKYTKIFVKLQQEARENNRRFWSINDQE